MDFNRYFNNSELEQIINTWAQEYSAILSVQTLSSSFEGKPIALLIITNQASGDHSQKPAVWCDANIHATEIAGTTTVLALAHHLLSQYGGDAHVTRLIDTSTFYLVPRLNPDGAALAMAPNPKYVRSSVRPYPWEDSDEGVHQKDIDGDGRILQMRIIDPNGDWKVSALDSRLMQKRGPDEHGGIYYRVFPEGEIQDWDGYLIKMARPLEGLDFNRNFPGEWRPESEQGGAGPYPASEPEIRGMVDFIARHPNINIALTYHTFSGVILRPYDTREDDRMDTNDLWVYKRLGARGTEITGYPCISVYHDFRYHPKEVISGTFDQWLYDHFGIFSFTVELWDLIGQAGIKERKFIEWFREHPHEQDLQILKWVDEHAPKDSYIDWYEYNHPQLGKVELGGWNKMYTWRNPPPNYMAQEANKNVPFVLMLAETLPHLNLHTLEVKALGQDRYWLNLVVENSGFLPTYTCQQGRTRARMRSVRAELRFPSQVKLVSGKRKTELGHLEGRSNKLALAWFGYSESPTDNRARTEWVLEGPQGSMIELEIKNERSGILRRKVILE